MKVLSTYVILMFNLDFFKKISSLSNYVFYVLLLQREVTTKVLLFCLVISADQDQIVIASLY